MVLNPEHQFWVLIQLFLLIINFSGIIGKRGWYISPVLINITISSSIVELYYKIDNGEYIKYIEPFTIYEQGNTTIYFKWRLNNGLLVWKSGQRIRIDYTHPEIKLIKPELGKLYLFGLELFRLGSDTPLMVGKSEIGAYANDDISGVYNVSFSLLKNNKTIMIFIYDNTSSAYEWTLTGRYFGKYTAIVEVEDRAGLTRTATRNIKIIQLGFLKV